MRVAVDATPLRISSGGLRRYVEELVRALAKQFPQDTFTLMSSCSLERPKDAAGNVVLAPAPRGVLENRWWSFGVSRAIRNSGAQVFHGTNFEVPYRRTVPAVMTLHDLSPWKNKAWHDHAGRVRRRGRWLLRARRADLVITPSEAVRREAINRFHLSQGCVVAVPHAAGEVFRPVEIASGTRPYFLFAATIEPRKNAGSAVEAWRRIRASRQVDLVVAGRSRSDAPAIAPEPGLILRGEVTDAELAELYSGALGLIYPSDYEGFGLPVLEAMQCGCPCVISPDAALREVGGEAAMVAAGIGEIAQAMEAICENPALRADLRERGLRRAAQFSWANTASATRAVYQEAIARSG